MKHSKNNGWCVACEQTGDRKEFLHLPNSDSKRKTWIDSLGDGDIEEIERIYVKIDTVKEPLLCKIHFLESDFNNGRVRGGSLPRMKAVNNVQPASTSSVSDVFYQSSSSTSRTSSSISREGYTTTEEETAVTFSSSSHVDSSIGYGDVDDASNAKTIEDFDAFIVDKKALMSLLEKCSNCGGKCTMTTYVDGAVLRANRTCDSCHASLDPWSSSQVLHTRASGSREKLFQLNLDLSSASLATGNSFKDITAFMDTLNIPVATTRTFDNHVKNYIGEAIERKYHEQRESVLDFLLPSLNNGEPLNVSGDGQYDSVGFSANYCKYSIQENQHGFVLAHTVKHKKRGGSSAALEHKGHAECLKDLNEELQEQSGVNNPIGTFTSDRCGKVADEMRSHYPGIGHFFDSWHFFRNVMRELLKRNQKRFEPIKNWIRHINNQLYWAVESSRGDGQLVQEKIMSTLEHICGNHSHFQNSEHFHFSKFFSCDHGTLDDDRDSPAYVDINTPEGRNAIHDLKLILTKAGRLEAAARVSCFFSTSNVEAFNALSLKYHPKRISLSEYGFNIRAMLAAIDWNSKKWEEVSSRRTVVGKKRYYNKTKREMVWRNVKTAPDMSWRREILDIARRVRYDMNMPPLQGRTDYEDDLELMDEWELDYDDGPEALRDDDGDNMIMRLIEEVDNEEEAASEEL